MDPLTQSLLGAAAAHACFGRRLGPIAGLVGGIAGELPDIDVVFPPLHPALPFELHRHFTHSLLFVPVIALAAALPAVLVPRWRPRWKAVGGAAAVGAVTHGPLDTCTTYGTYLLWPLVDRRLAWDLISIIDPVFTVALLIGIVWALLARSAVPARVAMGVAAAYMGLGVVQHGRAAALQRQLAAARGHEIVRGRVMPTLGNMIVWRSVYEAQGTLWADAARIPVGGAGTVRRGERTELAHVNELPGADRDVAARFAAFADGYIALVPASVTTIADMRYSMVPEGFVPLWGVAFEPAGPRWVHPGTDRAVALTDLWHDVRAGTGFGRP